MFLFDTEYTCSTLKLFWQNFVIGKTLSLRLSWQKCIIYKTQWSNVSCVTGYLSSSLGTLLYFISGIASFSFGQQTAMTEIISCVFGSSLTQELFFSNYRRPQEHLIWYTLCHKTTPSFFPAKSVQWSED